jgi:hypothetical protein
MNIRGTKVTEIPKEIRERFDRWYASECVPFNDAMSEEIKYNSCLNAYIEAIRMMCVDATAYEEYQLYCCFDKPV